jgi:hypothetical protein
MHLLIALSKKIIINLYCYFSNFFVGIFSFNTIRCVYLSNINKAFKGVNELNFMFQNVINRKKNINII